MIWGFGDVIHNGSSFLVQGWEVGVGAVPPDRSRNQIQFDAMSPKSRWRFRASCLISFTLLREISPHTSTRHTFCQGLFFGGMWRHHAVFCLLSVYFGPASRSNLRLRGPCTPKISPCLRGPRHARFFSGLSPPLSRVTQFMNEPLLASHC